MILNDKGKVIHHNDCTYCIYRADVPLEIKRGKTIRVKEICRLTKKEIPPPGSADRYCEHYVQKGCTCPSCAPNGAIA